MDIRWEEVQLVQGGVMVFIPHSKTDRGEGAFVFVADTPTQRIHPGAALRQLQQLYGGQGGAVFTVGPGDAKAISKATVAHRLRQALRGVGVQRPELYATHSLRRGGATHAGKMGIPMRMVMVMGRWKSDVVRQYMYCSPEQVLDQSRILLS